VHIAPKIISIRWKYLATSLVKAACFWHFHYKHLEAFDSPPSPSSALVVYEPLLDAKTGCCCNKIKVMNNGLVMTTFY